MRGRDVLLQSYFQGNVTERRGKEREGNEEWEDRGVCVSSTCNNTRFSTVLLLNQGPASKGRGPRNRKEI